jgi:hypothetical protein
VYSTWIVIGHDARRHRRLAGVLVGAYFTDGTSRALSTAPASSLADHDSDRDSIRHDLLSQVDTPSRGRITTWSRIQAAKMPTMTSKSLTGFFRSTVSSLAGARRSSPEHPNRYSNVR